VSQYEFLKLIAVYIAIIIEISKMKREREKRKGTRKKVG
jgi:hypothetical protein